MVKRQVCLRHKNRTNQNASHYVVFEDILQENSSLHVKVFIKTDMYAGMHTNIHIVTSHSIAVNSPLPSGRCRTPSPDRHAASGP